MHFLKNTVNLTFLQTIYLSRIFRWKRLRSRVQPVLFRSDGEKRNVPVVDATLSPQDHFERKSIITVRRL